MTCFLNYADHADGLNAAEIVGIVISLLVIIILISTLILVGILVGKRVAHPTVRIRKKLGLAAKSVRVESYTAGPEDILTLRNTLNSSRDSAAALKEDLENTLTIMNDGAFSDKKAEKKVTSSPSKDSDAKSDKGNKVKATQQLLESSLGSEKVEDVKTATKTLTKSESIDSYEKVDDIKEITKQPSTDAQKKVGDTPKVEVAIIPPPPAPKKVRDSTETAKPSDLDYKVARAPTPLLKTSPNQSYGLVDSSLELPTVKSLIDRPPSPNPRTSSNRPFGLVDQAKNSLGLRAEKAESSSELPTVKSILKAMEANKDYEVAWAPTPHLKTTPNKSYGLVEKTKSSSELPTLKTMSSIDDYEPVEKPKPKAKKVKKGKEEKSDEYDYVNPNSNNFILKSSKDAK